METKRKKGREKVGKRLLVLAEETGEILREEIVDREHCITVTKKKKKEYSEMGDRFTKMMDRSEDLLFKLREHYGTYYAACVLSGHLEYNSNLIVRRNGGKYTIGDLANDMGISRQQASKHFERLIEVEAVKVVPIRRKRMYAMNPFYFFNGDKCPKYIKKVFGDNL